MSGILRSIGLVVVHEIKVLSLEPYQLPLVAWCRRKKGHKLRDQLHSSGTSGLHRRYLTILNLLKPQQSQPAGPAISCKSKKLQSKLFWTEPKIPNPKPPDQPNIGASMITYTILGGSLLELQYNGPQNPTLFVKGPIMNTPDPEP